MENAQTKNVSYRRSVIRSLKSRISDIILLLKCLRPGLIWLYQNRHLRMDANVSVNDVRRREFHKDRYEFAAKYLIKLADNQDEGMVILDAACGTGYGSDILKKTGNANIFGVDISLEAIAYASRKYGNNCCAFKKDDVTVLSGFLPDSLDAVVSFETIEHIDKPLVFLERIKSLLKPGGVLILSTPNQWGKTKDHKFDYDHSLLVDHVQRFFELDELYVQNSGCMELWINRNAPRRITLANENNIPQAECFIAICRKESRIR
jgi:2-polyprenyl-3-methyl-5-hydroxy-6-metoxy-1,4-benzoquinol methylase